VPLVAGWLKAAYIEPTVPRKLWLLQRKTSKVGDGLGKTTGWIHRTSLKNRGVEMIAGVTYRKIDDAGLHITVGEKEMVLPVDNVVDVRWPGTTARTAGRAASRRCDRFT
jgi:2,4-dienoyl-CoA reductase (NADPH2)